MDRVAGGKNGEPAMERFEFKPVIDDTNRADTTTLFDETINPEDLLWDAVDGSVVEGDLTSNPPGDELLRDIAGKTTPDVDTATSAEADLTYDQMTELARMMAPTPGIEGTDFGSGS